MLTQEPSGGLPLLVEGAVALGLGLFIGLEREHRHVDRPDGGPVILGVRSFALLALAGWLAGVLEPRWGWLPPVLLGLMGLLVVAQYLRESAGGERLGLTTEMAALLTMVYGLLVRHDVQLAVALSLVTTLVLISKPWVRGVVPRLLRMELVAALQFLIVAAVVLPLLPEQPVDPWGVLPPRKIGMFVVSIAGLGFVGYVLTRLLGRSRAAGLMGLVGGLVSSTAVTVGMAQQAAREPAGRRACELAVFAANAVMSVRVLAIAWALNRPLALALAAPMLAMALALVVAALLARRGAGRTPAPAEGEAPEAVQNPFALLPALKWGLMLCAVLLLAHFGREALGDAGLLAAAALAGLTDVDAITLASSRGVEGGTLPADTARLAILVAVASNTLVKGGYAWVSGGAAFGRAVGLGLLASLAAAALGLLAA